MSDYSSDSDRDDSRPTVEQLQEVAPVINQSILFLVSALGGPDYTQPDQPYVLGDDALACLKDLKRWLKAYDQKLGRYDVALAIANSKLVRNDLLEILAQWDSDSEKEGKCSSKRDKIALGTLEILTHITWPLEPDANSSITNFYDAYPTLKKAQLGYKRDILTHQSKRILRAIIRLGLPSILTPRFDRTARDEAIIRLIFCFFRNLSLIEDNYDDTWEAASRGAMISAFNEQAVFDFFLTISASILTEFSSIDVFILEIIYNIFNGIDIESVMRNGVSGLNSNSYNALKLQSLLDTEEKMQSSIAATRHNRFGTMLSIVLNDNKRLSVSSQEALVRNSSSMAKLDSTKKWRKPKRRQLAAFNDDLDKPVTLPAECFPSLKNFANEFLENCFNPLVTSIRKSIERDDQRVLEATFKHYLYSISLFIHIDRLKADINSEVSSKASNEINYNVVASALNLETIIIISKIMSSAFDNKDFILFHSAMKCFKGILVVVHDMHQSSDEEVREISTAMQSRLFNEETTLNILSHIPMTIKNQGLAYLDASTDLVYSLLKVLEKYSKTDTKIFVKSKKGSKKNKNQKRNNLDITSSSKSKDLDLDDEAKSDNESVINSEDEEDIDLEGQSKERLFNYKRFEYRFINYQTVDMFMLLLEYYKELNSAQIKRVVSFLNRVMEKAEKPILLYRLDYLELLRRVVDPHKGINSSARIYVEYFYKVYMRKLVKVLKERPIMYVEMLFDKLTDTAFYLQDGIEKVEKKTSPMKFEVKPGYSEDEQIRIAVAAITQSMDENKKRELFDEIKAIMTPAINEKKSRENMKSTDSLHENNTDIGKDYPLKTDNVKIGIKIFTDGKLRLLFRLLGCIENMSASGFDGLFLLPNMIPSEEVREKMDLIDKFWFSTQEFEDGLQAKDFLSKKRVVGIDANDQGGYNSEIENEYDDETSSLKDFVASDSEEDDPDAFLHDERFKKSEIYGFPAESSKNPKRKEKKILGKSKRRKGKDKLSESELELKRKVKKKAENELRAKIKSSIFVHDSDDDSDDEKFLEFFKKEEEIRKKSADFFSSSDTSKRQKLSIADEDIEESEDIENKIISQERNTTESQEDFNKAGMDPFDIEDNY